MVRLWVVGIVVVLCLVGCAGEGQEPTRDTQERMYRAAMDAFFRDGQAANYVRPDLVERRVAYIEPEYLNGEGAVPEWIAGMAAEYLPELDLERVMEETQGGVAIGIGAVRYDDEDAFTVYGRKGPTIGLRVSVLDMGGCGNFIYISYLLEERDGAWQAQQYLTGVC